jgi:hypothetical protein
MGEPAVKRVVGIGGHGQGHRHGSVIAHDDPLWSCQNIVELSSQSFDRDLLGVGSSPYLGDAGYLGIRVPQVPTIDQQHRYLFRLVAIQVANNRALIVKGLRQYLSIGAFGEAGTDCVPVLSELEVTSPAWHFADGNVSWHLRYENDTQSRLHVIDPAQQPGTSPSLEGTDPVLLYTPTSPPFPASPYVPPGAGIPPPFAVDALGTWHDLRFPWDETHWEMSIPLRGPGTLVFYASVHQTDPEERCPIFVPTAGIDVLSPEDQFVAAFEADEIDVMYQRVAGALTVELFPCCR